MRTTVIAASLLFSSIAHAQSEEEMLESARAEITQGAYETGIAKLEQIHKTSPRPALLLEIATAYAQWQGHCQDAITNFDRFFETCNQCESFEAAKERNARVRASCQVKVHVESEPAGAMISIDGSPIGTSPLDATLVAGQHGFEAELSGYGGPAVGQTFAPGQADGLVKLRLDALPAFIELQNFTTESTILVSGVPATAPKMEVKPGKHRIEAKRPGYDDKTIEVFAHRGQTTRVDVSLVPSQTSYRTFMWASVGVGAFALISAGAFGIMSREAAGDKRREEMRGDFADAKYLEDLDGRLHAGITRAAITGGIAGAAAISALVFFFIEPDHSQPVALAVGSDGVLVSGRF